MLERLEVHWNASTAVAGSLTCEGIEGGNVIGGCVDSLIKLLIKGHTFVSHCLCAITLCHRL